MNITFRQLRLFLALSDTGSVSGAARAMHVTQPTASMQLKEVSRSVGLPLYEVVSRRVHLTDAGRELARTARAIVDEWDAFSQKTAAMKGLESGHLRVSVVSTAKYFMPRLLGAFSEAHPGIDISLEVLNRDGVLARLRENRDDLYIMSMPPRDIELDDQVFLPNPLVLIAAAVHPLARRRSLRLTDLGDARFILREQGSGTRIATDAHFRNAGFQPQVRMELGSNEAIRESVAANLGISVLSVHALQGDGQAQGLRVLPVEGFPIRSQWHIVRPRARRASPVAAVFEQHLLAHAAALAPASAPDPAPDAQR